MTRALHVPAVGQPGAPAHRHRPRLGLTEATGTCVHRDDGRCWGTVETVRGKARCSEHRFRDLV